MAILNCSSFLWENVRFAHVSGAVFVHNTRDVMIRNMYALSSLIASLLSSLLSSLLTSARLRSINNRGAPIEENGDLEVGGVGSHGEPYADRPDQWQWHSGLMSANNITIRDSWVDGGDDNVRSALRSQCCAYEFLTPVLYVPCC